MTHKPAVGGFVSTGKTMRVGVPVKAELPKRFEMAKAPARKGGVSKLSPHSMDYLTRKGLRTLVDD